MASQDDQTLSLGLGFLSTHKPKPTKQPLAQTIEPSLTLTLFGETYQRPSQHQQHMVIDQERERDTVSAASSLSNTNINNNVVVSVKRERETTSSEDLDIERGSEEDDGSGPINTNTRKKLRLTKDQSALLEESFKQHSTLNPKQKQALADRLNLRPRQVEVWFQNRRARTKLKQTEVDCEYLKKCCETLTDENRRLQKELAELKALKMTQPALYMHLPAATLTMCPSCERIGAGAVPGASAASKNPFTMGPKPHFYSSFPNPSAAC